MLYEAFVRYLSRWVQDERPEGVGNAIVLHRTTQITFWYYHKHSTFYVLYYFYYFATYY